MMTRGQNNRVISIWVKKDVLCLSFSPGKATLPSFPNIWERRKDFFFQNVLLKSEHILVALLALREHEGKYEWACPATSRYGSIISVIPLRLSFGFAFIFSLQTQRVVCRRCAGLAGYFLVGCVLGESGTLLFAGKSWLTKTSVFTRKQIKMGLFSFVWWWLVVAAFSIFQLPNLKQSLFKFIYLFILFFYVQSSCLPKHTHGIKSGFKNILKY